MPKKPDNETDEEAAARRMKAAAYMRQRRQQLRDGVITIKSVSKGARKMAAAKHGTSETTPEQMTTRSVKAGARQRQWPAKAKLDTDEENKPRASGKHKFAPNPAASNGSGQRQQPSLQQQQRPSISNPLSPSSNEPTISITTIAAANSPSHIPQPFILPLALLRLRSPFIDTQCADIQAWHQVNAAIKPGPKKELVYTIHLPEVEWHVFASYACLVMTTTTTTTAGRGREAGRGGEIELDFVEAPPMNGVEDAWERLVDLWGLCERLGDWEAMRDVVGAMEEHVRIDFPGAGGVKKVFELGEETMVLKRMLVDEVVGRREGRELLAIVADVDCAEFHWEVMAALVEERDRGWRPVRRLKKGMQR